MAIGIRQKIAHAQSLISNALLEQGTDRLVLSFNGGKDCTVLLDLLSHALSRHSSPHAKIKTVYVAEADPFPEVEQFIRDSLVRYPFIQLFRYEGGLKTAFVNFARECQLTQYAALVGVRRTDPFCGHLREVHMTDNDWPPFLRIHPILDWDYADIWHYMDLYDIEYCSLYQTGYTSIGSIGRTRPNPHLRLADGTFAHARELQDGTTERDGRHA